MKTETPLIERTLDEARRLKWDRGARLHRTADRAGDVANLEGFVGDPLLEAFEECCDLLNYLEEAERQFGRPFAIQKEQVRQIAAKVQMRWRAAQPKGRR